MYLSPKQREALDLLTDNVTKFLGYGGGAGGGKSYLGCYWLASMCIALPESKWFIGRESLKDTRESVLFTFRKVMKDLGRKDWKYKENHIYFKNGSEIEFLDLSFYPQKDPLYERFGSKEYTGGWIEEAGPVHHLAFDVLQSRINRWYNEEFGILGKILVTFNPKRNWVYDMFYKPWKKKEELMYIKFIRALATDNPKLPKEYIENLRNIQDKNTRERLLNGNFEYDDDPTSLIDKDKIDAIFDNVHILKDFTKKHIVCDAARHGSDRCIIAVFYGWVMVEYYIFPRSDTTEIETAILALRTKHGIGSRNCVVDDDGVGGGIVDHTRSIGFINGSKGVGASGKTYNMLKSQCGYKLAELIDQVYIECDMALTEIEKIKDELSMLKTYDNDKDNRKAILPKEKIKDTLGRSPDWLDVFIMLMYFSLKTYRMR